MIIFHAFLVELILFLDFNENSLGGLFFLNKSAKIHCFEFFLFNH